MSILTTDRHVQTLETSIRARGCRPGKAFRRFASNLRYSARCHDLDVIRAEAMATRKPTWADMEN
jgi:hypothetical protein